MMANNACQKDEFVFRKNDDVGAAAAEDDAFLADCFTDTGDLKVLVDCADCKRIVVGRTGAGKSALLATVAKGRRSVATWEAALTELVHHDLLAARGHKGEIFEITKKGYEIAEGITL